MFMNRPFFSTQASTPWQAALSQPAADGTPRSPHESGPVAVPATARTAATQAASDAPEDAPASPEPPAALVQWLIAAFQEALPTRTSSVADVADRFAREVDRICRMSHRIQASGDVAQWQQSLARHRVDKCLHYFQLGSHRGRVELHSTLSAIAYRYIAPRQAQLGFEGRHTLLEDFLQGFYIEVLKAFRREHPVPPDYSPRTRLELAEYMAFTEQYAKRRITIPGAVNQQILVLRAQNFARRQPAETSVDLELAMESPKGEEAESHGYASTLNQVREQMVTDAVDPAAQVLRDRVIQELMAYLSDQEQQDCMDYFVLRLQDLPASEIDEILQLTPRQRDYLQQRFKYHVEKFAQVHNWELVHQWLEIDLDHNLGLSPQEWEDFVETLNPLQRRLLLLKRDRASSQQPPLQADELSELLGCTPKRVQRTWGQILGQAWKYRNQRSE